MCTVLDSYWNDGVAQGYTRGCTQGESRMGRLFKVLRNAGRDADFVRAVDDDAFRQELYKEFNIE